MNKKITASLTLLPLGIVLNGIGMFKMEIGEFDLSFAAYCICSFIIFMFYSIYMLDRDGKYTGGEVQYGHVFMSRLEAVNWDVIGGAVAFFAYSGLVMRGVICWITETQTTSTTVMAILNLYLLGDAIRRMIKHEWL